jgi:hypothetical protein
MRRTLTVIAGATALILGSAGLASASPAWSVQPTPVVPGSDLSGVSCASASDCEAVGGVESYPSAAERVLAEAWNGSTWTEQAVPSPAGATDAYLYAVSCASAEDCIAVGDYEVRQGPFRPFAEQWDGGTWTLQPMPEPAGSTDLSGVSCASATSCMAVGNWESGSGVTKTLAEYWDGSTWTILVTLSPSRSDSNLQAVSCPAAGDCTAVGSHYKGRYLTLAEHWNGTAWSVEPTPNSSRTTDNFLNGVSCSSTAVCTAVGATLPPGPNGPEVPLAERWSGGQWKLQPIPSPANTKFDFLDGVWCASATACTAVGQHDTANGNFLSLAEHWDGTAWRLQPTAKPTGHQGLRAVWCTSASTCSAVGANTIAHDKSNALAEGTQS